MVILLFLAFLENIPADERFDNIGWSDKLQMTVNVLFVQYCPLRHHTPISLALPSLVPVSLCFWDFWLPRLYQNWQLVMFGLGYRNVAVVTHARETPL